MAGQDALAPFIVEKVEGLEDILKKNEQTGHGAYGAVYKVSVRGIPCVAKRLHKVFMSAQVAAEEKTTMQEKFRRECAMLSKLRHPNVVHFVGVHFGQDKNDVTLLMECLSSDLADFVKIHKDIPLSVKLSILLDVSYGIIYLHTRHPPIIHRDLTARNVLITADGQAKIADLGVSKFYDVRVRSHTQTPGHLHYMPPESLRKDAECTKKLDVFSFGHLAVYTLNQEAPMILDFELGENTLPSPCNLQTLRRQESINQVGENHCMYPLINQCLQDSADNRPTTEKLCLEMKELCSKHPKTPSDIQQLYKVRCG